MLGFYGAAKKSHSAWPSQKAYNWRYVLTTDYGNKWTNRYGNHIPGILMKKNPLVKQFANLKMAIEIVSFPINRIVIFHSYVNVYPLG